jgi:hypothetical protein
MFTLTLPPLPSPLCASMKMGLVFKTIDETDKSKTGIIFDRQLTLSKNNWNINILLGLQMVFFTEVALEKWLKVMRVALKVL